MRSLSVVEERALAAARAVAGAHGLSAEQAAVVYSGSNVLVRLNPAPVVARVMTGTVALHEDPQRWLTREVSVLNFLAPTALAVGPSSLIAPGPYKHAGLWMTCWEWVEHQRQTELPTDAEHLGGALRDLHRALAGFGSELGDLGDVQVDIERLLGQLRPTATLRSTAIDVLRAKLHALTDQVFASPLPGQPLHGDASLTNLLRVQDGFVWNDFEDVCRGPAQWDVAGFLTSLQDRGADPAFTRRVLDAYGDVEEDSLAPFAAAHDLYGTIWRMYDSQRHQ
jgi:hypothetical protein